MAVRERLAAALFDALTRGWLPLGPSEALLRLLLLEPLAAGDAACDAAVREPATRLLLTPAMRRDGVCE